MKHLSAVLLTVLLAPEINAESITFVAKKHFLNIPVTSSVERKVMTVSAPGCDTLAFVVRLADGQPEYWVSCDISSFKGKKMTVTYDGAGLNSLTQTDGIANDAQDIYSEGLRPQQHFTYRRGWNNDPNGMIYFDGEYHLFGQHNPYENKWENMHWGHAVSKDLIHWKELPDAIPPGTDLHGIFSGTVIVDKDNVAGFAPKGKTAMIAYYTLDSTWQVQCMAYSIDNGRSWTKYEGNPIIDSYSRWNHRALRDPKVFHYDKGNHWVMVLYERTGASFYTSTNLKDWTYRSHIDGIYECPDFYELPVDGNPLKSKWVLSGASGAYFIGDFDGSTFTPDGGKHNLFIGKGYAGQTFNDCPGYRRIQILWEKINYGGKMPFCGMFSTPLEMSLRTTADGTRLFAEPVREFDMLQTAVFKGDNLSGEESSLLLNKFSEDGTNIRVKGRINQNHCKSFGLNLNGQNLFNYSISNAEICGQSYPKSEDICSLNFDLIIDKASFEVIFDSGARVYIDELKGKNDVGFKFQGEELTIEKLEIYTLSSIWESPESKQ